MNEEALEERKFGEWQILFKRDGSHPTITDLNGKTIATVHGPENESFQRALLIAKAPSLGDAVRAAITGFQAIAENQQGEPVGLAALDMLPAFRSAVYGFAPEAS